MREYLRTVVRAYSRTLRSEGVFKDCSEGILKGCSEGILKCSAVMRKYTKVLQGENTPKYCRETMHTRKYSR